MSLKQAVIAFYKDESGATLMEYGLIVALLSVTLILTMTNLGTTLKNTFINIHSKLVAVNS